MGGGLGQSVDLRGAWQERGGGVFEGGVDTPMHTTGLKSMNCYAKLTTRVVQVVWKKKGQ